MMQATIGFFNSPFMSIFHRKPMRPIEHQVSVFLKWGERQGISLNPNKSILELFTNVCTKRDIFDVEENDVSIFLDHIRATQNGQYVVVAAKKTLYAIMRFYKARNANVKPLIPRSALDNRGDLSYDRVMMNLANESRNKELVKKRIEDPRIWSYGALGRHYNIDKTTAEDIFKRDLLKYATESDLKKYHQRTQRTSWGAR